MFFFSLTPFSSSDKLDTPFEPVAGVVLIFLVLSCLGSSPRGGVCVGGDQEGTTTTQTPRRMRAMHDEWMDARARESVGTAGKRIDDDEEVA